ncbi:MAG: hypothetical protein GY749_39380 [Desulfobacteraceae bacterium]|nr:hypothetical protein [Desulfobacteraceae bacterium]
MNLKEFLNKRKNAIIKKWFDMVVDTYPADTSRFLKSQKDPFSNPVGATTMNGLEALFDELLNSMNHEKIISSLDPIIRIRAVQDFSPSKAAGFTFFLKTIIRENINKENHNYDELLSLESNIDEIGLIGFDIYMKCREKIFDIRANEHRNRFFSAFERAGLIKEEEI